ncbi:probable chitinase 10 [Lucilia cuprina]|uniref:probable chitinase 10 n=1 Tax=Lucilia cuprina TaxID=7375 RepID=UPI001F05F3AE|nr:probable chitinase 10 [Lucilia cuprina]
MKLFILTLIIALKGLSQAQEDLTQLCLDQPLGHVLAHPLDCGRYIVCNKESEPSVYNCELGFHFDALRKVCNWPEYANCQVATPNQQFLTTAQPWLSSLIALDVLSGETIDPLTNYDPDNVLCRHYGAYFLPHPQKCRSYYLCAYGHMHEHSCGVGTLWNYLTQQCVLNYNAECYHLADEEEQEIVNTLATTTANPLMVCYTLSTTITSTRPTHTNTTPFPTQTPRTTKPSRPTAATTTRYHPSTKRPNSSNPYHIVCSAKRQSYAAHPKDCGKYFICIMGTPVETSCPVGLFWDSQKEYCDLPENVKCFSK